MSDIHDTLDGMRAEVWARLMLGVVDAASAARFPVLATVSPTGLPEARTVVLRGAEEHVCEVHTDLRSDKIASLRATPCAALLIWEPEVRLQIRLACRAEILEGDAVVERWAQVPDSSQTAYGKRPPPGTVIADSLDYELAPGAENFAALRLEVDEIDAVHLGPDHRRARFERRDGWAGRWLSP
ncbi:pyridoxamine 5'-phosphate oxidase family protein [Roseisalinus antarcticus]|uniref:Pyridoxamine 5'-phosphate oxidase n=1 Tax=Roseisalinus antarcticus TaxID=254357 RepID=A0A1Y5S6N8_9RHOB|nr:pyridoxamine 5'-phosphate oxidase family protein [Roseisalinus antarcticus]SLN33482.1 pyridoxamine 5'-phosphate oxidase [Roseisalinus antarcticus]